MKTKLKYIALTILLCVSISISAQLSPEQKGQVDSLKQVINSAKHDTTIVNAWLAWDNIIYVTNPKLDFELNQKLIRMCAINFKKQLNKKEKGSFLKSQGFALNNVGIIYKNRGDYAKAIDYQTQSLKTREKIGDKQGIASSLNSIGVIYYEQGEATKAIEYYTQSLKIREGIGDKKGIAASLNNIGLIYKEQRESTKAIDYYTQSLKIERELGNKQGIATTLNNIGIIHYENGESSRAIDYYIQSMKTHEEIGDKKGIARSLNNIGIIYNDRGYYSKALGYNSRSLKIAQEVGAAIETKRAAKSLWETNKALGRYKDALSMYELYIETRDSLESEENRNEVIHQEFKYNYEKKAATDSIKALEEKKVRDVIVQKEIQKQKFIRNIFISGFLVVILCASIFLFQRNKIKKGKKRSDDLLLNILPHEVAEELKAKGSADAKHFEEITVMFTDFKGFTQISEKLSPTELVSEIDTCFKAFDLIITKHNIEKIKTIGDAYMCAGGLPTANKTHANDVIKAALEIQTFMAEHLKQRLNEGEETFEIRIGIHTGSVVAGIVGVKKFAYDIWGDTVNIASRMESSGEAGKINISGSTFEIVKNNFKCTHRGKIHAKGKGEIDMYFVEA